MRTCASKRPVAKRSKYKRMMEGRTSISKIRSAVMTIGNKKRKSAKCQEMKRALKTAWKEYNPETKTLKKPKKKRKTTAKK